MSDGKMSTDAAARCIMDLLHNYANLGARMSETYDKILLVLREHERTSKAGGQDELGPGLDTVQACPHCKTPVRIRLLPR